MKLTDGTSTIDVCVIELHSTMTNFELEFKIAKGNLLEPNAQFLSAIVKFVRQLGVKITLSGAWQLWRAVCLYVDRMRKRNAISADIAHWFNVNPFELTDDQQVALYANINRVQAQTILNTGNFSPTDYQGAYELTLLATGSEQQAQAARALALKRYVDAQIAKEKQQHG